MGLGAVGGALARLLERKRRRLERGEGVRFCLRCVLVRDLSKHRDPVRGATLVDRPEAFQGRDFDLVVEALGGLEPAGALIRGFLERGVPVVTANKALLAERGPELLERASRHGTLLRFEASVAAGIPILGLIEHSLKAATVRRVSAILNGTSNHLFTAMEERGVSLEEALREAMALGFAESDVSLDLSGTDAAQKMTLLARALGAPCPLSAVERTGIEAVRPRDFALARLLGGTLKPVAQARIDRRGARGFAAPAWIAASHPLAGVHGADNGILLEGDVPGPLFFQGPGAGGLPTASALLDDMLAVAAHLSAPPPRRPARSRFCGDADSSLAIGSSPCPHRAPCPLPPCRWFLAIDPGRRCRRPADLLDWAAGAGLSFRELRMPSAPLEGIVAGIVAPVDAIRVTQAAERLRGAGVIETFLAFRVLERAEGCAQGRVLP